MSYRYFVSYVYDSPQGIGFENVEVPFQNVIGGIDDIRAIESALSKNHDNCIIKIINWQMFERSKLQ